MNLSHNHKKTGEEGRLRKLGYHKRKSQGKKKGELLFRGCPKNRRKERNS